MPALTQYSCVVLDGTGREQCEEVLRISSASGSPSFGSGLCPCLSYVVHVPIPGHIFASPDLQLAPWLYLGPTWSPPTSLTITGLSDDPGYCWQTCSSHLAWDFGMGVLLVRPARAVTPGFVLTQPGGAANSCSL